MPAMQSVPASLLPSPLFSSLHAPAHIGIAGAGVLGRLLAWQLARAGHKVTVVDPASGSTPDYQQPRAAGFTAAGMLSPLAELECADWNLAELGWWSIDLWRAHVEQLRAAHQQDVYFAQRGSLLLAHGSDMGSAQRLLAGLQSKAPAERRDVPLARSLGAQELQEMEPGVSRQLRGWLLEKEGQIHTVEALVGLVAAAEQCGAVFRWNTAAREVLPHAIDGERFDWVFDTRGLGARDGNTGSTATLPAANCSLPPFVHQLAAGSALPDQGMRGVRGEVFWLHAPGVELHRPVRLMHPRHRVYVVPRPGDMIVVGASEIESEDRSPVSLRSTVELLAAAHAVLPELTEARVVHMESNLRPALPDNMPLIQVTDGLTRINGLFRHGWLIAPALVENALQASNMATSR